MTISVSASFQREFTFIDRYQRLNTLFSFKNWLVKVLDSLLNYLAKRLINHIDDAILVLKGAVATVKDYDQDTAKKELKDMSKILKKFIQLEASLSEVNYIDRIELKEKLNTCISCLYDIDLVLRKKAFQNQPPSNRNPDFIAALAMKSQNAIAESLAG